MSRKYEMSFGVATVQHGLDMTWRYCTQVTDFTCRVRFMAGADRIWHVVYRVAAD